MHLATAHTNRCHTCNWAFMVAMSIRVTWFRISFLLRTRGTAGTFPA